MDRAVKSLERDMKKGKNENFPKFHRKTKVKNTDDTEMPALITKGCSGQFPSDLTCTRQIDRCL